MKTAPAKRPSGQLQRITKRARGNEYPVFRWRYYRQGDTKPERVDVELGKHVDTLRTRVLIALGELSAPLLMERWARWRFNYIDELPAWSGQPKDAKGIQKAAWWLELPRQPGDRVKLRFRSLARRDNDDWTASSGYDFRWKFHRERVAEAEEHGRLLWQSLSDDPVLELAKYQWLIGEMTQQIERCEQGLQKAQQQRRQGDLDQRDFEAEQRHWLTSQDRWEGHRSDIERAWDWHLERMVAAMPRSRREDDRRRILALAERHLADGRQQQRWRAEHWDDGTLNWTWIPPTD